MSKIHEAKLRKLARQIACQLFRNGDGDVADTLQLRCKRPDGLEYSGGGWCEAAAADKILQVLKDANVK